MEKKTTRLAKLKSIYPDRLTIKEFSEAVGYGQTQVRHAIRKGTLRHFVMGRRWLIPQEEVDRVKQQGLWLEGIREIGGGNG